MRLELTRRADYAVRAALALAEAGSERLSVRQVATERGIPPAFLPRIMADLARGGLVEATPGRTGGYRLARPAAEISLLDIIDAVDPNVRRRTCVLRGGPCQLNGVCSVHDVFATVQIGVIETLGRATLGALVVSDRPISPRKGGRPARPEQLADATVKLA
jgi:Rrf2 family protein